MRLARPKPNGGLQPSVRTGGEAAIELSQPRHRECTVPSREVFERGIEFGSSSEPRNDLAKVNDLGANRQRREQSATLQRLGLIRQCREAAVDQALPVLQPR